MEELLSRKFQTEAYTNSYRASKRNTVAQQDFAKPWERECQSRHWQERVYMWDGHDIGNGAVISKVDFEMEYYPMCEKVRIAPM